MFRYKIVEGGFMLGTALQSRLGVLDALL